MEDPTKTFEPGKKITLFDKSKQKYTMGALLIKTDESISEELPQPEVIISQEILTNPQPVQENFPTEPPKDLTRIQMLSIIVNQIVWIYLLFIHKTTWSLFYLIKQKIHKYQSLDF